MYDLCIYFSQQFKLSEFFIPYLEAGASRAKYGLLQTVEDKPWDTPPEPTPTAFLDSGLLGTFS